MIAFLTGISIIVGIFGSIAYLIEKWDVVKDKIPIEKGKNLYNRAYIIISKKGKDNE